MSLFLDNVAKLLYRFTLMIIGVNLFLLPVHELSTLEERLPSDV